MSKSGIEPAPDSGNARKQRVLERIEIGNAERVGHQRTQPAPRPGPTGTPLFLAQLIKSATIRK
jgi:hypothetical protein